MNIPVLTAEQLGPVVRRALGAPEFGEVHRWPEEMAREQSVDVDAAMDTWCDTFRFLLTLGERATRAVPTNSLAASHARPLTVTRSPLAALTGADVHERNRGGRTLKRGIAQLGPGVAHIRSRPSWTLLQG
jgi:hypothetical protein